jgi:hypothetical protein
LCYFSSTFFCCLLLQEFHDHHSLTSLPLFLFFLFPYLPQVQLVLLYSHFTIAAKSARPPWVCSVGTSREGSRTTSLWLCSFLGNNTHKVHYHHMKFDNSEDPPGSSFLPHVCVFLFLLIYLFVLSSPLPSCYYKNNGKM